MVGNTHDESTDLRRVLKIKVKRLGDGARGRGKRSRERPQVQLMDTQ